MAGAVLITGKTFPAELLTILTDVGYIVDVRQDHLDEGALGQALVGKQAYILGGVEFATARAIQHGDQLKVIAVMGTGYQAFVDVSAATERGILVTNTPQTNTQAVAEMTIGLMLAARRKISWLSVSTKAGSWTDDAPVDDIRGLTLGIIGMGTIGSQVARMARRAFDMNVLYYSRARKSQLEQEIDVEFTTLESLLKRSDIVSLHCSITEDTKHMISRREFSAMKQDATLINAANPHVVDPEALASALTSATIACCAMDGYYIEPAPSGDKDPHGLLRLSDECFIVTPHVAYLTHTSIRNMASLAARSVVALLRGEQWRHIVNRPH